MCFLYFKVSRDRERAEIWYIHSKTTVGIFSKFLGIFNPQIKINLKIKLKKEDEWLFVYNYFYLSKCTAWFWLNKLTQSQKHWLELAAQAVAVYVSYVYFSVTGNEAGSSWKVETLHNTFSWCSCLPPYVTCIKALPVPFALLTTHRYQPASFGLTAEILREAFPLRSSELYNEVRLWYFRLCRSNWFCW